MEMMNGNGNEIILKQNKTQIWHVMKIATCNIHKW